MVNLMSFYGIKAVLSLDEFMLSIRALKLYLYLAVFLLRLSSFSQAVLHTAE